ncbi:MAG: PEFG-CTERM sorting domain-containing protein [Patescibacteria group bacterium]|nr:PEFG-CTERM sorting domain-containing protein [Patescibacteria group bacterium]
MAQIDVSSDGKFTKSFLASGPLWKSNGTYTVKVQYGLPNVTAQSRFTFQSSIVPISNILQVKDPNSGQTFAVNYTISGGTLNNITIDQSQLSLIISINSTQDGSVQFKIPRALIDSKAAAIQDVPFLSLIGGSEVKVQDVSSDSEYRTIAIPFQQGDQQIQVIGTQIIPEFGSAAIIVLFVSIASIILISMRQIIHLNK